MASSSSQLPGSRGEQFPLNKGLTPILAVGSKSLVRFDLKIALTAFMAACVNRDAGSAGFSKKAFSCSLGNSDAGCTEKIGTAESKRSCPLAQISTRSHVALHRRRFPPTRRAKS